MKKWFLGLFLAFVVMSCQQKRDTDQSLVAVSIEPQAFFVKRLLGDSAKVMVMISSGSSHASYSPTTSQMRDLSHALAYLRIGYISFENTWSVKFEELNPEMKWYDLSKGIVGIGGHHHGHEDGSMCHHGVDPHIWTSPAEVLVMIENLKNALIELYPAQKEIVLKNYIGLYSDVDALHQRLLSLSAKKRELNFMIFHPAYTYLARSYGFTQLSIEIDGKSPTPSRLKETIDLANREGVKTIFIQKEFDKTSAQVIADEIEADVVQVNPMSGDWLVEMDRFITLLEK